MLCAVGQKGAESENQGPTLWEGDGEKGTLAAASTDSGAGQAARLREGGGSWGQRRHREGERGRGIKGQEPRRGQRGGLESWGRPHLGSAQNTERCAHRLCPPAGLGFPVCEITWSKALLRSELRWGRGERGSLSPPNLLSSPPASGRAGRGGARAAKAGGPPRPPGRRGPQPGGS